MSPAEAVQTCSTEAADYLVQLSVAAVMAKLGIQEITITRDDLIAVDNDYTIHREMGFMTGWTMKVERKAGHPHIEGRFQEQAREIIKKFRLEDKP